jgi:hypothetical protein
VRKIQRMDPQPADRMRTKRKNRRYHFTAISCVVPTTIICVSGITTPRSVLSPMPIGWRSRAIVVRAQYELDVVYYDETIIWWNHTRGGFARMITGQ